VGTIAPGVSSPAFSPHDGRTLPEVISPLAWEGMLEQVRQVTKPIGLWLRHTGKMLAATSLGTLRLEVHPILGGMFEAKIESGPLERMLLAEIGLGSIGCSIGFHSADFRYEQREGREVRVVRSCVVEHVALVRKNSGERALYHAARCFAVPADKRDQLLKAWSDARAESWKAMKVTRG
jgi:phage head maturation protease